MDIRTFLRESEKPSTVPKNIFRSSHYDSLMEHCLPSQKIALEKMMEGKNICLTGSAGTGKTYILQILKQWAEQNNKKIAITALTGTAAFLLGGKTIHSWSGIGLGTSSVESVVEKCTMRKHLRTKWRMTDILVIDEISMMSPELFSYLDMVAQGVRRNDLPFGGLQLIVVGDFCQLPPVVNIQGSDDKRPIFCFESISWDSCIDEVVVLKEIVRQTDPEFQECLNHVRMGNVSPKVKTLLESRIGVDISKDGILPTRIYPNKKNVDYINRTCLQKLAKSQSGTKCYRFNASVENIPESSKEQFFKTLPCVDSLKICVGAQVMLVINLNQDEGLVNGSRGVVQDIKGLTITVKFYNGITKEISPHEWMVDGAKKNAKITQLPIILAWAITIHKSQGASLDLAEIDVGECVFECGQTYVALSRVRSLQGLRIVSLDTDKIQIHPLVKAFYEKLTD
jgi:ATP-dependent DNA helicase PIF1